MKCYLRYKYCFSFHNDNAQKETTTFVCEYKSWKCKYLFRFC